MRKQARFLFYIWLVGGLAACALPAPLNPVPTDRIAVDDPAAIAALLTGTAASAAKPSITLALPAATASPQQPTPTLGLPLDRTPLAEAAQNTPHVPSPAAAVIEKPCDLAQPGRPIDVTVPDESRFRPGEYFAKTWRLVNAGTCPWTENYAVVWFSGDDLGLNREQALGAVVQPGKSIDVTVDMIAPHNPGFYQSNWKMRGGEGNFFGIGPNGDSPFWVRIEVIPVDTPTPEPTEPPAPTQTAIPLVLLQGERVVMVDEGLDLDPAGILDPLDDITFRRSENGELLLVPENGARLALMIEADPAYALCRFAPLSEEEIFLDGLEPGISLCYSTSTGLPGHLQFTAFDPEGEDISLSFLTWAVQ